MDFERLKKLECGYFLLGARSEKKKLITRDKGEYFAAFYRAALCGLEMP
jgi:hypothetical protein